MSTVRVELTGDEQRLLASLDKVIAKEKKLAVAASEVHDKSAQGGESTLHQLRQMDQAFGKIFHMGQNVLSILGIGGGIAGAVGIIRQESERAEKNLQALGKLQLEAGKGELGLGTKGGAGAVGAVQRLARDMGVPEDVAAKAYEKASAMGLSPGATISQARRDIEESLGGKGYRERRAGVELASPRAGLAAMVEELKGREAEALRTPKSMEAARKLAAAQIKELQDQISQVAAVELGYSSPDAIGTFSLEEKSKLQHQAWAIGEDYRKRLGFTGPRELSRWDEGTYGALGLTAEDREEWARRLMDSAAMLNNASGDLGLGAAQIMNAQRGPRL